MGFSGISESGDVHFQGVPDLLTDHVSSDVLIGVYVRLRRIVIDENVNAFVPTKFKRADQVGGVVDFSIGAYARRHGVSNRTVGRWLDELEELGVVECQRRSGKNPRVRVIPWNEFPEVQAARARAAQQRRFDAEKSPQNQKGNGEKSKLTRAGVNRFLPRFDARQVSENTLNSEFPTQDGAQVFAQEEFKKEYKKNSQSSAAHCEKGLPFGSLDTHSGAEAPPQASNEAFGELKGGLTASAACESQSSLSDDSRASPTEAFDPKRTGTAGEGGATFDPANDVLETVDVATRVAVLKRIRERILRGVEVEKV